MTTIKKLILLALTAAMIAGCTSSEGKANVKYQINNNGFQTIVIDSCEYLIKSEYHSKNYNTTEWGYGYMAHKGNCRFCKERRQKEREELIIKLKEK